MKVLLINGSPHVQGCTHVALTEVAKALNEDGIETQEFHIGGKGIHGCVACGGCAKTGLCIYRDDPVNECIQLAAAADGIIVGSPVYFAGPNGSLCAFLDRMFFLKSDKYAYKPAAAVVSCRRGGASAAFERLNKYFMISNMPVVSSQYWNEIHGVNTLDVKRDLEGLQIMRTLGHNMAWLLKCIAAAKIEPPVREKAIATNFIRND